MTLSREDILGADDLKHEVVQCPEWGGDVIVWEMNGKERDEFEMSFETEEDEPPNNVNVRARLAAISIRGDDGRRLFTWEDVEQLGTKSGKALTRVIKVAQRLSAVSEEEIDEIIEDFGEGPRIDLASG